MPLHMWNHCSYIFHTVLHTFDCMRWINIFTSTKPYTNVKAKTNQLESVLSVHIPLVFFGMPQSALYTRICTVTSIFLEECMSWLSLSHSQKFREFSLNHLLFWKVILCLSPSDVLSMMSFIYKLVYWILPFILMSHTHHNFHIHFCTCNTYNINNSSSSSSWCRCSHHHASLYKSFKRWVVSGFQQTWYLEFIPKSSSVFSSVQRPLNTV